MSICEECSYQNIPTIKPVCKHELDNLSLVKFRIKPGKERIPGIRNLTELKSGMYF